MVVSNAEMIDAPRDWVDGYVEPNAEMINALRDQVDGRSSGTPRRLPRHDSAAKVGPSRCGSRCGSSYVTIGAPRDLDDGRVDE